MFFKLCPMSEVVRGHFGLHNDVKCNYWAMPLARAFRATW